jgi:hypothetical protein
MKLLFLASICAGLVLGSGAALAGTVQVVFVQPDTFTDAGDGDREANSSLQAIADYLQWLGRRYLPPEQSLDIEVLDVDLAGKVRPTFRWGIVRVVGKPVDWPQIKLRYRLHADGKTLGSGEASIADMAYSIHLGSYTGLDTLSSEKHMLRSWFRGQFAKK